MNTHEEENGMDGGNNVSFGSKADSEVIKDYSGFWQTSHT